MAYIFGRFSLSAKNRKCQFRQIPIYYASTKPYIQILKPNIMTNVIYKHTIIFAINKAGETCSLPEKVFYQCQNGFILQRLSKRIDVRMSKTTWTHIHSCINVADLAGVEQETTSHYCYNSHDVCKRKACIK